MVTGLIIMLWEREKEGERDRYETEKTMVGIDHVVGERYRYGTDRSWYSLAPVVRGISVRLCTERRIEKER